MCNFVKIIERDSSESEGKRTIRFLYRTCGSGLTNPVWYRCGNWWVGCFSATRAFRPRCRATTSQATWGPLCPRWGSNWWTWRTWTTVRRTTRARSATRAPTSCRSTTRTHRKPAKPSTNKVRPCSACYWHVWAWLFVTSRERPKSALYLRLKKRKVFKIVKGWPF